MTAGISVGSIPSASIVMYTALPFGIVASTGSQPFCVQLIGRKNVRSVRAGGLDLGAPRTARLAHPDLRHAGDLRFPARPAQWTRIAAGHAANFVAPVEMRIDMKYMDRLADGVQRIEHGNRHAMITAERENLRTLFP